MYSRRCLTVPLHDAVQGDPLPAMVRPMREECMTIRDVPTLDLERRLASQGADLVIGFDEVGRGALAGPVMVGAAAVWSRDLGTLAVPDGVADSKLLTERRREALYDPLRAWCAGYAVGQASNAEIDDWGIGYALGIAALRAIDELERSMGVESGARVAGILDGPHDYITKAVGTFDAPPVPVPVAMTTLVKADRHCATVAAAAVIAKVTRDRLMIGLSHADPAYEPYGWAHNKGYGSSAHRDAIERLGPSDLHRVSWRLT